MKRVTIKTMHLVNFRGHKDLKINFSDLTEISGDNRLGKSTVFDAFVWGLFGKDQFDRKDFEITPIVDGKRLDRVDSEVIIIIDYDGREMELKRVLHQKWVRRRGTAEEVFDGCETLYYINDVPLKASEYKARVDLMIEETVFKLITNPAAFLGLHWTKQREFLFQIAGTVSDAEIAASDDRFLKLLDLVNGKSLIEFKKEIAARKKKLKADLEDINPKIDQTTRLMPAEQDWSKIESDIAEAEKEIALIDAILSNHSKAVRAQYEDIQGKRKQIDELKNKQREVVNEATQKEQQTTFEVKRQRDEIESEISRGKRAIQNTQSDIDSTNRMIQTTKTQIDAKEQEIDDLRAKWNAENEKEYTEKAGGLFCPVYNFLCDNKQANLNYGEAQEKAKTAFFEAKQKELEKINEIGAAKKKELTGLQARMAELEIDLHNSNDYMKECEKALVGLNEKLSLYPVLEVKQVIASELPQWQEFETQIRKIESEIEKVELNNPATDTSEYTNSKAYHNQNRDMLKATLNNRDIISKYKAEIKNLEIQASELAQQIADLEKQEFTIDAFNKVKIDECDRRINRMFQIVKFQLFDKTNEGNEFEACIPLNKAGVPIAATNTAERINAGLDIINTLSNFYNVSAPVFIDNSEAVNAFIPTNAQMVNLRVTKESVLTIK